MSKTALGKFSTLRIGPKLTLIVLTAALTSAIGIGASNYINASDAMRTVIGEKLEAVVAGRKASLQDYLSSIAQDMRFTAESPLVRQALHDFSLAFPLVAPDPKTQLQQLYITDNPNPTGEKENLDAAPDGSLYSQYHADYHPWFRSFLRERGYYDIFLFDLDGNLVYSVFKELDYATNLMTGQWRDTDLGNAFRAARDNGQSNSLAFFDFQPYAPSHDAPASFISTPITGDAGKVEGILVFQMPIERINSVMANHDGLGANGEVYILGQDRLMRNDSRFATESTILAQAVDYGLVDAALAGSDGILEAEEVTGYRGNVVIAAAAPLDFEGTRWVLVAEVDKVETFAPVTALRNDMILVAGGLLLLVCIGGLLLSRRIAGPLARISGAVTKLSEGNTSVEIVGAERPDEIGDIARALEVFKTNAVEMERPARRASHPRPRGTGGKTCGDSEDGR